MPPTRRSRATCSARPSNYGYLDARLLRNELRVDPPNHKADAVLEMETGLRYRFGTTTDRAGGDRRCARAPVHALRAGRAVRHDGGAAHPVRARRQPVFLHRRSAAGRAGPREPPRAREHSRGPEPAQPLFVRRAATEPTRTCAARFNGKTAASTAAAIASTWSCKARVRTAEPGVALHHSDRRSGAREARVRDHVRESSSSADVDTREFQVRAQHHAGQRAVAAGVLRHGHEHVHAVGVARNARTRCSFPASASRSCRRAISARRCSHARSSCSCVARITCFGSDSDFLQLDTTAERTFDLTPEVASAAARRSRREPRRRIQPAARHRALLRRWRPQRARLRLQRAVARGAGTDR